MEKTIQLVSDQEARDLFGDRDQYLRMIRNHYDIRMFARAGTIKIAGEESVVLDAYGTMLNLLGKLRAQGEIRTQDVESALLGYKEEQNGDEQAADERLDPFEPKTEGQRAYAQAIRSHTITFGVGPAGTGKTFLAVSAAVSALVRGQVKRLLLARPAVEAGEKLGFLPGDFQAKVNPYLRPIFDALGRIMVGNQVSHYMERDIIEVVPLAFMRGRTLDNAFIILDEAQNTTPKQMLMALTRLGARSKMVVTGDISQTDLPDDQVSGLEDAIGRLEGVPDVCVCRLQKADIVRHPLVQAIVDAYEEA